MDGALMDRWMDNAMEKYLGGVDEGLGGSECRRRQPSVVDTTTLGVHSP